MASRSVATAHAFDFVAADAAGGAMLIWSPPAEQGGGVRLLPLDALGGGAGQEREVMPSRAPDKAPVDAFVVRAAVSAEAISVAWVERQVREFPILASVGPVRGEAFPEPVTLRTLSRTDHPYGTVAVSMAPAGPAAWWIESPKACEDGRATISFSGSAIDRAAGSRRCAPLVRISAAGGGRIQAPGSETEPAADARLQLRSAGSIAIADTLVSSHGTVLALHTVGVPDRESLVVMVGDSPKLLARFPCRTIRLSRASGGVLWQGTCGAVGAPRESLTSLVSLSAETAPAASSARHTVQCKEGGLLFAAEWGNRVERLSLTAPTDRISAWLPAGQASETSRAVWTGEALLVVTPNDGEASLRRYECVEANLVRTDLLS